jgi:Tol biopolymer transport system component
VNDNDQTILSSRGAAGVPGAPQQQSPQDSEPKRNPLVIIGGIGCALVLCLVLAAGIGLYFAKDQLTQFTSGLSTPENTVSPDTPTIEAEQPATLPASTEATSEAEVPVGDTPIAEDTPAPASPTPTETPSGPPQIASITFAKSATADSQPIDPGTSFEGELTEIHAVFEYSGFPPNSTWERVWYLDGAEMLRSTEPWTGADSGVFDYFINAGGQPLSPGEWKLELYLNDELLASDTFTIVDPAAETAKAQASATAEAMTTVEAEALAEPAVTPTITPTVAVAVATPRPVIRTYKLAYTKWDGGSHNLYVGDTNGANEQFILSRVAGPSWTPDGAYIFFYGEEGVDRQTINGVEFVTSNVANGIVRMNASPIPATLDQVRLYQGPGWNDGTARWANVSPNGQMVAYDARPGGDYRIYFLGTNENQQFRFEIIGEQADWSPDSQKIVYRSGRDGRTGIWISNRDDSGHTQISSGGSDSFPAWSPDGQTIVFHRDEGGDVNLYAMNTDGSNIRQLTTATGPDTLPVFTPSGEIIFRSARSGSWGIWKMNIDGSNQQEIIPNAGVGNDWAKSHMSVLP